MGSIYLGIIALVALVLGIIILVRILNNMNRVRKAEKYLQNKEFSKALELFLKALKFNIGTNKGSNLLERVINVYELSGTKLDTDDIRKKYDDIVSYYKLQEKGIENKKMKDSEKMDAFNGLSDRVKIKFDHGFVKLLPKI